jgi:lysophospholipase L1-like esterase
MLLILALAVSAQALASEPLRPEAGFGEFDRRARAGERLTVAFFGASLTWGANASDPNRTSYRALVAQRLEQRYPNARFRFIDAAIGGTGSQLGIFRLDRDVLPHKPDLVFLDFSANDTITTADRQSLASYEAIVRRIIAEAGAPVVQVIFPFQWDLKTPGEQLVRRAAHRKLSEAYGTACGDAIELLKRRVADGAVKADELWPVDPVHPCDKGYVHFADAAWTAFEQAVAENRVCRIPPQPLHGDLFLNTRRARLAELLPPASGWARATPLVQASNYDMLMSRWLDSVVVARQAATPAPLRVEFRGQFVMLFGEGTTKTGKLLARIDGQPVAYMVKKRPETVFDPGALARRIGGTTHLVQVIASDCDPSKYHVLEIEPVLASPDEELRIESLCVAGGEVDVRKAQP